ncbi:TetR/AcrR family transcriptional regulator C-terminal domain-containing protein [Streptomyces puniciscabiei]
MRRIAAELGTGTTSLYRHITGKDEVIELMVDTVFGEQPLPEPTGQDWRAELAEIARGFRAALLRHPWLAQQASRRLALGPRVIKRTNHALGVVGKATDDATLAGMIVIAVDTYVLGFGLHRIGRAGGAAHHRNERGRVACVGWRLCRAGGGLRPVSPLQPLDRGSGRPRRPGSFRVRPRLPAQWLRNRARLRLTARPAP